MIKLFYAVSFLYQLTVCTLYVFLFLPIKKIMHLFYVNSAHESQLLLSHCFWSQRDNCISQWKKGLGRGRIWRGEKQKPGQTQLKPYQVRFQFWNVVFKRSSVRWLVKKVSNKAFPLGKELLWENKLSLLYHFRKVNIIFCTVVLHSSVLEISAKCVEKYNYLWKLWNYENMIFF